MPQEQQQPLLIGVWQRAAASDSGENKYPETIEVRPNGTYLGRRKPGQFTWWDVGRWKLVGPGQIRLSTANDAEITYPFRLDQGQLVFTLPEGKELRFAKLD